MIISWHGFACFKIQGQNASLVTDPFDMSSGLKVPKLSSDIVVVTQNTSLYNNIKIVKGIAGDPFFITSEGEYEVKDVYISGLQVGLQNKKKDAPSHIIYKIEIDDVRIAHLGGLYCMLSDSELDFLDKIDVLLIPVGSGGTLDASKASELIQQIEPRLIIPMHYKVPGAKAHLAPLEVFRKEIGIGSSVSAQPKAKIIKKDLPSEDMQFIILGAS